MKFTLLSTLAATLFGVRADNVRNGVDFFVVGDFGWVRDMHDPNMVFDAIETVKSNAIPNSNDDAQFFMTVGDNLYPVVETAPTDDEFATMMGLF